MAPPPRQLEDWTGLRAILVAAGLGTSAGFNFLNLSNRLPSSFFHTLPHGREFFIGLNLVSIGAVLDAVFQFGIFAQNASRHLDVDAIFFGLILGGVYLESRFLPWTLGTCHHYESWRTTPDGRNLFTELMKKKTRSRDLTDREASSTAHLICHDLVVHHGVAITLLCFHVFCAATQIIETFGSLRSFFHLPLPLYLLSIPFVILFQAKSCIHYLRFRTTFHSNNKLNDKRFRNITLPANVIANITRLGKLHYSDLYNLRLSSKKLSYVFFGDDVGASLRALRGVPCGQDERLKCYNCKLPGCHYCLFSPGMWSGVSDHVTCLPYCKRHQRDKDQCTEFRHRQCRLHMKFETPVELRRTCELCHETRSSINRASGKQVFGNEEEINCRRRRLGWKGKILCATCKEDLTSPSSRYWRCPCGIVCEKGELHDLER